MVTMRRVALAALRRARPFVPVATRVMVFLSLAVAAGAPSFWAPSLGVTPALGAYATSADAQRDPMTVVYQGGDPEATPTPTLVDPNAPPVDPAALPIDTATPTNTPPPPPPPAPSPPPPPPPSPSPTSYIGDPCWGDEQITFIPADPRTSNELVIAVTSSRPHPYGRIAGTEKATFVRERPGQLGYVWEWTVALTWPGKHEYTFYVDSTVPCKKTQIQVKQQYFTPTPKPTKTPKPDNENNN
jgi:hypothetical protein